MLDVDTIDLKIFKSHTGEVSIHVYCIVD